MLEIIDFIFYEVNWFLCKNNFILKLFILNIVIVSFMVISFYYIIEKEVLKGFFFKIMEGIIFLLLIDIVFFVFIIIILYRFVFGLIIYIFNDYKNKNIKDWLEVI